MGEDSKAVVDWESVLLAQGVAPAQIEDVRRAAAGLVQALDAVERDSTLGPDYLSFWQQLNRLAQP